MAAAFMSYPAASSIVSRSVSSDEQGLAQGAIAGVRGLTQYVYYLNADGLSVTLTVTGVILAAVLHTEA